MKFLSRFRYSKKEKGFGFVDVLVGTSLMLIVFMGIFGAYQLGMQVMSQSKNRISATAIANQKVEMIRNLPYMEIGTSPHSAGEPDGNFPQITEETKNNVKYTIRTRVIYVNDCFDGPQTSECPSAPLTDTCVRDYKRAEVNVSWQTPREGRVVLATDIAPKNLSQEEQGCTGKPAGVLSVAVFDALGQAVSSPLIEIIDPATGIVLSSFQPLLGSQDFVLDPNTYGIKVSKTGCSSIQTYGVGEVYEGKIIADPEKDHSTLYEGRITQTGFSIDKLSSLNVKTAGTEEQGYPPMKNVSFQIRGEKIIGQEGDGDPIYKYQQALATNENGEILIPNLEWDSYSFTINSSDYNLFQVESPASSTVIQPVDLLPGEEKEVRLVLRAENTLSVTIKDASSTLPILGASVRVSNSGLGYSEVHPTDGNGKTIFLPLERAVYNLEIEATGYEGHQGSVSILGNETIVISLDPLL